MKNYFWILGLLFFIFSCQKNENYEQRVEKELASGVRHDSLFLGLKIGMTKEAFYAACWEMNKKQIIREGKGNTSVLYEIDDFKHDASMFFYPNFYEDKIYEMPMVFEYKSWSPWNKELHSDKLLEEVLGLLEEWFGKGFVKMKKPNDGGAVFVKVDGNRRITAYSELDSKVKVYITDLLIDRLKKENKKKDEEK